jgi:hypothetical protein
VAKQENDKIIKLVEKLNKQMSKANKTREKLEKLRAQAPSVDSSFSHTAPS